jgi:N utilization substance protein B
MPVLDRAIARIGAWEILYNEAVPDGVAIAEAVESAQLLSTEDSAGFLNGVLGAIARDKAAPAPSVED